MDASKFSATKLMPFLNTNEFHVCGWVSSPKISQYIFANIVQVLKKEPRIFSNLCTIIGFVIVISFLFVVVVLYETEFLLAVLELSL